MIFYFKKILLLAPLFYFLVLEVVNFFKYDGLSSNIGVTNLKIMIILLLMVVVLFYSLLDNLKNMLSNDQVTIKTQEKKAKKSTVKEDNDFAPPCEVESARKSSRLRKQTGKLVKELTGKVHPLFKLSTTPLKILVDDDCPTTVS